ncbi:MAG: FG-GAP repeat domain-containing protein [Candidatus Thorarchaeota archaeon]
MTVSHATSPNEIVVTNDHFTARIDRTTGQLASVHKHNPDDLEETRAVVTDRFRIRTSEMDVSRFSSELELVSSEVEEGYDFYVRVVSVMMLKESNPPLYMKRIYDFTRSKTIYEQASFYVEASTGGVLIEKLDWLITPATDHVYVARTAYDLFIQRPDGPLGGLNWALDGSIMKSNFAMPPPFGRTLVHNSRFFPAGPLARISPDRVYIVNGAICIGSSEDDRIITSEYDHDLDPDNITNRFQYYAGFGILRPGIGKGAEFKHTFVNWNEYTTDHFIPVRTPRQEDFLIRISMHVINRMKQDGGWPKWPKWDEYPRGDIFTPHSRCFPHIAYLWAYLALSLQDNKWIHTPCDADLIYDQLQYLYQFYVRAGEKNFVSRLPDGTPYISYSANRKTGRGRGVLNSHAHALHFAWIMQEVSTFRVGGIFRSVQWRSIVERYHAGSKALFNELYPHKKGRKPQSGIVRYSLAQPNKKEGIHWYNSISFEGIAAGYLQEEESEIEFVDAVERAVYLDYNPWLDGFQTAREEPFVARLCRILPIALAFIDDKIKMTHKISAASIDEVMRTSLVTESHENQKAIVEGNFRKIIFTNKAFDSDWLPGYWEKVSIEDLPPSMKYEISVTSPDDAPIGNWAAYRKGNLIEVMTDFNRAGIDIEIPGREEDLRFIKTTRTYIEGKAKWRYGQNTIWTRHSGQLIGWGSGVQRYRTLVGDVNGNGKDDLVFPFYWGREGGTIVRTLLSNGNGSWSGYGQVLGWGRGVFETPTLIGDINANGKADLAFPFYRGSGRGITVRTLFSNGDGTWSGHEYNTGWGKKPLRKPMIGDVNANGKADLVFPWYGGDGIGIIVRTLFSNGDGTWSEHEYVTGWGDKPLRKPMIGDVNANDKADLVFPWYGGDGIGIIVRTLLSNGDGTWSEHEYVTGWGDKPLARPIIADINGNGKNDLVFPFYWKRGGGTIVRALLSKGDGTWSEHEQVIGWGPRVFSYPTLVGDIDGDGKADLLFPFQDWRDDKGLTIRALLSRGDGTWYGLQDRIKWRERKLQKKPTLVGDVNGDKMLDVIFPFQDGRKGLNVKSLLSRESRFRLRPNESISQLASRKQLISIDILPR